MSDSVIAPEFWAAYAEQQRSLDSAILNAKAFALDESVCRLLDDSATGVRASQVYSLFHACRNRSRNKCATLRNRARLDKESVPYSHGKFRLHRQNGEQIVVYAESHCPASRVDRGDEIAYLQRQIPLGDWRLLAELASGVTYSEMSIVHKRTIAALKTCVSRKRKFLKSAC